MEERATEKTFMPTGEVRRITRRVRNNTAAPIVTQKRALGCTEGALCMGSDERLTTVSDWTRVGPENLLWAQTHGYVQGTSTGATKWKESFVDVDALGRPIATRAVLSGTVALDRRHAVSGRAVAQTPGNTSQDGTLVTGELTYDAVGHVVVKRAPSGACVATSYEAIYGDAVVVERASSWRQAMRADVA